jgi:adenylosuccinate lyase
MQRSDLPLDEITALSPLDGRYRTQTASLATYLSEFSLIRIRAEIETAYLLSLSREKIIRPLTTPEKKLLESLGPEITLEDAREIKIIEARLKHDVKAVEVFLREKLSDSSLKDIIEMIHFGLTSEDINNIAYRLMLRRATENIILPSLKELLLPMTEFAKQHKGTPMLARTHGQAAIPTTLGKEFAVFATRLSKEIHALQAHRFSGKLSGAVGNYSAQTTSYPNVDWISIAKTFSIGNIFG